MRAMHIRGLFQRVLPFGFGLMLLAGCDHHDAPAVAPDPIAESPQLIRITGYAVNGPLNGAAVRIIGTDGQQLESTTTGTDGAYHAQVSVSPPYRIEVTGGSLDGEPYQGVLLASCEAGTDCNITPFTTVIVRLMDQYGYNVGDARAQLAQHLNFDYDPFVRSLIDSQQVEEFDLDRARTYLDGGKALDEWVDAMLAWIQQPAPEEEPPAGIRYRYIVTATAGEGGVVSPALTDVEHHGRTVSLNLTPNPGYRVDTVTGCSGTLEELTYTTGPITEDCSIDARFTRLSYTIATDISAGGSIRPTSRQVEHGAAATFTLEPAAGYVVEAVDGCGGGLDGNTYTTDTVTAACTITASFSRQQFTVSASAGSGGTVSPTTQRVPHGTSAQLTLATEAGYAITGITGCGGSLSGTRYTTGQVTADCHVNAAFSLLSYPIGASANEGGRINPENASVSYGNSAVFTLLPDAGYEIDAVTGCNGMLSGSTYTTGLITGACAVNATFRIKSYDVSASASEGGSITPSTRTVAHGQTTTFTINAQSGYELDAISGCGGSLSGDTYTTAAITSACAVTASFILNLATPALSASPGVDEVTVSWAPVAGAEGYDLYYAEESFDPANYNSYAGGTLLTDVSSPRTVTGLSNGIEYFFSAAAKAGSTRRFSPLVSAIPMAACFGVSADDPQVCSGNGTCPATDTCECAEGFIGERCNVELKFSTGSREHYFPTTTGKYAIIEGPSLPPGETYVWKFEILATGYWPQQEGFTFGVAGYPLAQTNFHELGQFTDEYAYRGRDGRSYAEGVVQILGSPLKNAGDQIMLELNTETGVLNVYTKRVGESEFTLEGDRSALTNVFPKDGRVLHPAVAGICWQPCGIKFIE